MSAGAKYFECVQIFIETTLLHGLHVGDNQNTNNEVRIDSEAVNVITGGQMESKFTGSYIQFGAYQLRRTADNGLAFKVKEG